MPAPPDRSAVQRMSALEEANRVRIVRAELKRELAAGARDWRTLLDHPDTATMRVADALRAVPKLGRVKVARALRAAGVSPTRTFAGLTDRQRRDLERVLDAQHTHH